MTSIGGAQGYLSSGVPVLPGNIWGGRKPSHAGGGLTVQTDASGATGNTTKAANQSVASAAGLASNTVDTLSSMAKSLGSNPNHLGVISFTLNRGGVVTAGGELDANGDLNVRSQGSSDGAQTNIALFVPGSQSGSNDWSTQVANGLAQATYKLNSVLNQVGAPSLGATVQTSA